jgi:hypothetical protein
VVRRSTRIRRDSSHQIEKPIYVFISSSQREFASLREKLKAHIDVLRIERGKRIFEAYLAEKRHGERIQSDINIGLDKASIYVAIIGDRDSEWTMKEFEEAWMRGIPVLVYDYRKGKGRSTISRWLDEMKGRGIRIEVPDVPYRNTEDLINHIIEGLPTKLGELAEKYQQVRNIVARKELLEHPTRQATRKNQLAKN